MMTISGSQISVMNIRYGYYPLEKLLGDAVRTSVEHVELWGAVPYFHLEDMIYTDMCRARKQIEERGLPLVCYIPEQCIYLVNLAADSTVQRRRSLKYPEDNLRAAVELGTGRILVTTGWGYLDNNNIDEAQKYAREGLMSLGNMARNYGIKSAPEMLCRDKSGLIYNLPILKRMMGDLSHLTIGAITNTIPTALVGKQSEDYLKVFGEQLVHVYFIDGTPRGHLAWGDGVLDMKGYLKEFSWYSYKDHLSLEITGGRYRVDPISSVLQSAERLYDVLN